jgi:autotransporter adhesin
VGGGATYNSTTGALGAPTYNVAGGTQTSVEGALSALNTAAVQFNGTGGAANVKGTKVLNMAAGDVSGQSTEAVNGSQLFATNARVMKVEGDLAGNTTAIAGLDGRVGSAEGSIAQNTNSIADNATAIGSIDGRVTNIDGRVTNAESDIATNANSIADNTTAISTIDGRVTTVEGSVTDLTQQLNSGAVGLVQQDADTHEITVGKNTDGTVMNVAGQAGNRKVTGVAAGAVSATSVDAINGSQLYGTADSIASSLGGGAKVNADGTISAPEYKVGGKTVNNVGDAVTNLDDRVTKNTSDLSDVQNQLGSIGTQMSGGVQYDRNADGSVNFGSIALGGSQSAGPVVLTNVADGVKQYDAVNYGQLSTLQDQMTNLDGRVTNLGNQPAATTPGPAATGNVANVAETANGSIAIGSGAKTDGSNSVALGQGSVADRNDTVSVGTASQPASSVRSPTLRRVRRPPMRSMSAS